MGQGKVWRDDGRGRRLCPRDIGQTRSRPAWAESISPSIPGAAVGPVVGRARGRAGGRGWVVGLTGGAEGLGDVVRCDGHVVEGSHA